MINGVLRRLQNATIPGSVAHFAWSTTGSTDALGSLKLLQSVNPSEDSNRRVSAGITGGNAREP